MNAAKRIQSLVEAIPRGQSVPVEGIYLNAVKNEMIFFGEELVVPRIPVQELKYDLGAEILKDLVPRIPQLFEGHHFLETRKPRSELHSLQFALPLKGRVLEFVHLFKMDMRFGGDSSSIIERGSTDHYPSYRTSRIYYKSRLIPVSEISGSGVSLDFKPLRLHESNYVESDQYFHTFAVFDDLHSRELTRDLYRKIDLDVFPISLELYPFLAYDQFTACFNVLYPSVSELALALDVFEPLFHLIHSRYHPAEDTLSAKALEAFPGLILPGESGLILTEDALVLLRDYFRRYSLNRDDELALKGWWKFEIS